MSGSGSRASSLAITRIIFFSKREGDVFLHPKTATYSLVTTITTAVPAIEDGEERKGDNDDDAGDDGDDVSDDDEEDGHEGGEEAAVVRLGFLEHPLHPHALLRPHFPSKLGGKPAWLNPRDLPSAAELSCGGCQKPLRFLLQLYAPVDSSPESFHRALFVFVCGSGRCMRQHSAKSVKVVRSQLQRRNPFYSYEPPPRLDSEDEGGCFRSAPKSTMHHALTHTHKTHAHTLTHSP